ncbi:MAG: fumarate hydratase [Candidatus Cloacimonetes bacterium]|nr:fumarate hydratase [Candidatus Cloacimonadota bacterium]MBS3767273.1 fumarate hydratase [Candidatus Cloacimonadota bacterium]
MREIKANQITESVKKIVLDANFYLPDDVVKAIKEAREKEKSPSGKDVFNMILENMEISKTEKLPLCQDTGFAVFFVQLGQEVHVINGDFNEAINEGVRQAYEEGYLRKSIVDDPVIERVNTKDNTPAVIHTEIVPGEDIIINFAPKGGGSENMSTVKMMKAADGIEGVKNFVVDFVKEAGGNPCPPTTIGVGIGGTFDKVAELAKKAALRPIGSRNPDKKFADVELELMERLNKSGIGPMGLGGRITVLDVHIETYPCHIATMPVAINTQCHCSRRKHVKI